MTNKNLGPVTSITGGAAAATTVLIYTLSLFGIEMSTEVAGSVITLAVIVAGYFAPQRKINISDLELTDNSNNEGKHSA